MRLPVISAVASVALIAACGFGGGGRADGAGNDAIVNVPDGPIDSAVRFTSITATPDTLRPGRYGITVVAVLRNDSPVEITDVAVTLTFTGDAVPADRRGEFRWRDFDRREDAVVLPQTTIPSASEATYRFVVDTLAWAAPDPVRVNGSATFTVGAETRSATPLEPPRVLAFDPMNPPIVVNRVGDENDLDTELCFREALVAALTTPGLDRIVFDPAVFPPGTVTTTTLDEALGTLPMLTGGNGDIVIDGSGAGFELAVDSTWETPEGRYGLYINGGSVVVHGIRFRDMGYQYRNENVSMNNCGPMMMQFEGGAIRIDGGTLILDGNTFADPNVTERNCFAASVRLEAGIDHRIVNNRWTEPSMDAVYVDARTVEISGNVIDGGSNPDKADEGIYVNTQGADDLWIVGNLIVDQEFSAVIARGVEPGVLYVVNNTFVRNGRTGLAGVRREQGARAVVLRNNAYVDNLPAAVQADNTGLGFDLGFEVVTGAGGLCSTCTMAVVDTGSIRNPADPMVANVTGSSPADFTPQSGSEWVGTANDWIDCNGRRPGRHDGIGPERGAIETP